MIGLYLRVSTDEQAKEGFSLDSQEGRLKGYCESVLQRSDYRLYIEDGFSGKDLHRPAVQRLIRHIQQGKIDTVVVIRLDRLSRKQKDVLHLIEDVFAVHDIKFISMTENFDTSTPMGRAMIGIMAVFAQLERDTMIERVTDGRRERISTGLWYGGRIPFGYEWDKDSQRLVINPVQAELVRDIFKRFLQGHSFSSISDWANARTTERALSHNQIRDMVQRIIYNGKMNNAGEVVEGLHEAIIDDETWNSVQKEFEKRRKALTTPGKYLLTHLLECGLCGGAIVHVRRKQSDYFYEFYACKNQHVRARERTSPKCSLGYKHRRKVEAYVVNEIKRLGTDQKLMRHEISLMQDPTHSNDEMLDELNKKLSKIEDRLDNLYDFIETGNKSKGIMERIKKAEEEKESIILRIDELDVPPKEDRSEELFSTLQLIGETWDELTEDEQQIVLRQAVTRVILFPGTSNPEIRYNL